MATAYDHIVVGGGSAGAVLAARLSEDSSRQVLLLEAGEDHPDQARMPAALLSPHEPVTEGHNWDLPAVIREQGLLERMGDAQRVFVAASSRLSLARTALSSVAKGDAAMTRFDYPMGRVMGGSSAVNGALAMRGTPQDYEAWAALGLPEWSWPHVLDQFRQMETDADVRGPYSGAHGAVPISRARLVDLHEVQRAFMEVCQAQGFPTGDPNHPQSSGCGRVPRSVKGGVRMSSALTYLAQARGRPNLHIQAGATVAHVTLQGRRATGVEAIVDGRRQGYQGHQVILSAGALQTPAILMRSGIGPAGVLQALKAPVVLPLEGVGRNLIDHPAVGLWMVPKEGVCREGEDIHQAILRHSSQAGDSRNDLHLFMLNSVRTAQFQELQAALGVPLAMALSAMLAKPRSRGWLAAQSLDPFVPPRIVLNLATDPVDVAILMEGVRLAWQLVHASPLHKHVAKVFAWNQRIIDSDALLSHAISTFVRGSWHPVGTARMGLASDPMAVVDGQGRVHGCDALLVADASIMPTIPSAPPNLSCLLIGERVAHHLLEGAPCPA